MVRDGQIVDSFYGLIQPEPNNHQLHTIAAACGYDLKNHHHALADAEACAAIALYIL
jgi:DNA polymerase III epsilon subunit-like protein